MMPVSSTVYAQRKAQGVCVFHASVPVEPGRVLCPRCLQQRRDYNALQRAPAEQRTYLLRQRMRARGLSVVPAVGPTPPTGPNLLLCCGQWHPITHIPLVVPCCDRLWFHQREEA